MLDRRACPSSSLPHPAAAVRPSFQAGGSAQKKIDDMKSSSYYAPKQLFSLSLSLSLSLPPLARSLGGPPAGRQPASFSLLICMPFHSFDRAS